MALRVGGGSQAARTGSPVALRAAFKPSDLVAAFHRFRDDQITDHAAALTYYSLLSLFPALLFGVAVLGLFGEREVVADAVDYLREAGAPAEAVRAFESFLDTAVRDDGSAAGALALGLATALYGASGAFAAAGRALNVIWRVEEGRGFVRKKASDLAWTLLTLVLVIVAVLLVFLGGEIASDALGLVGLGETAASVWQVARWPGALVAALLVYAIVYFAAPNVRIRRWQTITPGAVFGVATWLVASAGFFLYVSSFGSYNATYGTFAGAVILLVWLWLTNTVLLFGAELNAVVRLRRTPELPRTYDGPPLPPKEPADS